MKKNLNNINFTERKFQASNFGKLCSLILMTILLQSFVYAQSKTGTTIGQFLKIEPSAKASAMGNASAAMFGEAASQFYNPAALGRMQNSEVQFTHNRWLADIAYNYAVAAIRLEGVGTFSLQATSLNSGEIDVRTVEQPLGTGERYTVDNFALGLGYGLMLTDRVSVGMVVNYINENIWHSSLETFGFNFGVQYQVEENSLVLGASVSNFGPRSGYSGRDVYVNYDMDPDRNGDNDQLPAELRLEKFALPTTFRAGISMPFKTGNFGTLTVAADAIHSNDNNERVNIGAAWNFMNYVEFRAGYRDLFLPEAEGGLSLGAGASVGFNDSYFMKFDYAWNDYGDLEETHRFTVGLAF